MVDDELNDGSAWEHFTGAIGARGKLTCEILAKAVDTLASMIPPTMGYGATGWHTINDTPVYLTAGACIGPDGPVDGVEVTLPLPLQRIALPVPPAADAQRAAWRASVAGRDVGPAAVGAATLGAAYLAPLTSLFSTDQPDFVPWVSAKPMSRKSEWASCIQSHFGTVDRLQAPMNFEGSLNSPEPSLYAGKDVLLWVDDYRAGSLEKAKLADRIVRTTGNRQGRARMDRKGRSRPERPPRGLPMVTGEEPPTGSSTLARCFVVHLEYAGPRSIDNDRLTVAQGHRTIYPDAMAGYVQWLAGRYDDLVRDLAGRFRHLRGAYTLAMPEGSARLPGQVAHLVLGWETWVAYGVAIGAIPQEQGAALIDDVAEALLQAGVAALDGQDDEQPERRALALILEALGSGRVHLTNRTGGRPDDAGSLGWGDSEFAPRTPRMGWVDPEHLYLLPGEAYRVASAGWPSGETIPVGEAELWRRWESSGLLTVQPRRGHGNLRAFRIRAHGDQGLSRYPVIHLRRREAEAYLSSAEDFGPESGPAGPDGGAPGGPSGSSTEPHGTPSLVRTPCLVCGEATWPHHPGDSTFADGAGRYGPYHPTCTPGQATQPTEAMEATQPAQVPAPTQPTSPTAPVGPAAEVIPLKDSRRTRYGVVDAAGLWLSNRAEPIPTGTTLADIHQAALDHRLADVWLHAGFLSRAGLPETRPRELGPRAPLAHPWTAEDDGLDVKPAGLVPWMSVVRSGQPGTLVSLGVPAWETRAEWRRALDGPELLAALERYGRAVGTRWRTSPNAAGRRVLEQTLRHSELFRESDGLPEPIRAWPKHARNGMLEPDFAWVRPLTDTESAAPWVVAADANGAYLPATAIDLGVGQPEHLTGLQGPDLNLYGWWHLKTPPAGFSFDSLLPDPLSPQTRKASRRRSAGQWVTTPTLILLRDLGFPLVVDEAYVWRQTHRWMNGWYERLRDARRKLLLDQSPAGELAMREVKFIFRSFVGWLGSVEYHDHDGTDPLYRPDVRHHVQATVRQRLYRQLLAAAAQDRRPFAADVDCFYYVASGPEDIPAGLKVDRTQRTLGHFKPHGAAPLDDRMRDAIAQAQKDGHASAIRDAVKAHQEDHR